MSDPAPAAIQDVGVDHGRLDIMVPEQLLDRPDVIAREQQIRSRKFSLFDRGTVGTMRIVVVGKRQRWRRSCRRSQGIRRRFPLSVTPCGERYGVGVVG